MAKSVDYELQNGTAKITAEWESDTDKMTNIVNRAGEYLHNNGYGNQSKSFDNLTNQEKLDVLLDYWTKTVKKAADIFYVMEAEGGVNEVKETREAELDSLHEMGS